MVPRIRADPSGIDAAAARNRAALNEPLRKLPEKPVIFVIG
jgi:hypothetical protein